MLAKSMGFGTVEDVEEPCSVSDFAERGVKEAGPHGAIGFDDGGGPWGVADRRSELREPKGGSEMACEAAQLFGRFADERSGLAASDEGFDLAFEGLNVAGRQRDIVVDYAQAFGGAVEGFRVRVDGEERDRIDVEQARGVHGFNKGAAVGALDRAPG
jgi:hypothetical protein